MSKRQQIVDAIETRMKTILTTGGYETNAGRNVFVWQVTQLADGELPAILIYDFDDGYDEDNSDLDSDCYGLVVQINFAVSGSTARTLARAAISDIRKATKVDETWGGAAILTTREKSELSLEQAAKLEGNSAVTLRIVYSE